MLDNVRYLSVMQWYAWHAWIQFICHLTTSPFQVLGVQLKSLYRFGHMSVCGEKLQDFKYCMSLKSMHPDDKRDAWIRHRAEWWASRRLGKSSEHVWDMRTWDYYYCWFYFPIYIVSTDTLWTENHWRIGHLQLTNWIWMVLIHLHDSIVILNIN